ncbi:MAG: hypothetical protein ABUL77_04020 [Bacteroidota bacterium]
MSPAKLTFGIISATLVVAASATGQAQVCTSNADCVRGTSCQASAVPPAEPARPSCGKEVDCGGAGLVAPAKDGGAAPIQMFCQPAPCKADNDCGSGMVCHSETISACSGSSTRPACMPNTACDAPAIAPAKETCTTTTTSACVYKWQLPCNTDADCGSNDFACKPITVGMCSGSGPGTGSGSTGGGSAPAPGTGGAAVGGKAPAADLVAPGAPLPPDRTDGGTDPTCTTTTVFPGYCQAKTITCNATADCPQAWTCAEPPSSPSGTTSSDVAGTGGGATRLVAPDAGTPADPPASKVCQAPAAFPARGPVATDSSSGPTTGQPQAPGNGSGPGENKGATSTTDGAGCSIAGGTRGASGLGLGVLVMASLLVRGARRRRR